MVKGKEKSEETTKGIVAGRLASIEDYPSVQNRTIDGVTWFKEDSYKGSSYNWLVDVFAKATKKQTMKSKGVPDFMVTLDDSEIIVVIECKGCVEDHSRFSDIRKYEKYGFGNHNETEKYAINGVLWYASFLKDRYDVLSIAVSGQSELESRVTSFVWPKGEDCTGIKLVEDGYLEDTFISIKQYQKDIDVILGRTAKTEDDVRRELRRYTLSCANFLRSNGIEDNSKAGFVSAVILGLTNHNSILFHSTKNAIDQKNKTKSKKMFSDTIGRNAVSQLKKSLYGDGEKYEPGYIPGVWDIDNIPEGKRISLKKFYDGLLAKDELLQAPKGKDKYFPDGDTVLSSCIYSLYENVIQVIDKYSGIDVMGEFYTTFLRFTKGNAKEKGIVLTPKHITELFCDIAEYYSDKKFDEKTKIIDICCGTGAFLISSLNRIKKNICSENVSEEKKKKRIAEAQIKSLIGVERDPSMFALAYANMRFHGDGKSNLFNCSSLLVDSYAPVDESGKTFINEKKVPLHMAIKEYGNIDIGMINPPYSLDKKENASMRVYADEKKLNELKELSKRISKQKSLLKNKDDGKKHSVEIDKLNNEFIECKKNIQKLEDEFTKSGMREISIQKGQDELDFIASMLHYLKVGGIGIAIVPMSCAGSGGTKLRSELMKYHTLLACMTMPSQLFFDSHVGTSTCVMVFKAHIPHDSSKSTFFGRWQDDGFKVVPHNGRKDAGRWNEIRLDWINQMDGTAPVNEYCWMKKKIEIVDEALPEAYIKTDFTKLTQYDFEKTLKKYALYKYMDENGLLEE